MCENGVSGGGWNDGKCAKLGCCGGVGKGRMLQRYARLRKGKWGQGDGEGLDDEPHGRAEVTLGMSLPMYLGQRKYIYCAGACRGDIRHAPLPTTRKPEYCAGHVEVTLGMPLYPRRGKYVLPGGMLRWHSACPFTHDPSEQSMRVRFFKKWMIVREWCQTNFRVISCIWVKSETWYSEKIMQN